MRAFLRDAVSEVTNRVTASRIVSKATSSEKLELDDDEALEVSQFANAVSAPLVVSNIKSRLDSKTPSSQYLTMRLISYLVDSCSSSLHDELARDTAIHQRIIQLAASLQEVDPGAARTAVKVRLEARRLLLELSRTFQGCGPAHAPLSTLCGKFEAVTQKKLERSVLMAPQRIRFRPLVDEDILLISPRGKRGSLTAMKQQMLAQQQQQQQQQQEAGASGNGEIVVAGSIITPSEGNVAVGTLEPDRSNDDDDVLTGSVVTSSSSSSSENLPPTKTNRNFFFADPNANSARSANDNDNDDDGEGQEMTTATSSAPQQHQHQHQHQQQDQHFTSPGDPLTTEELHHKRLRSPTKVNHPPLAHNADTTDHSGTIVVPLASDDLASPAAATVGNNTSNNNNSNKQKTTFVVGQLISDSQQEDEISENQDEKETAQPSTEADATNEPAEETAKESEVKDNNGEDDENDGENSNNNVSNSNGKKKKKKGGAKK